MRLPRIGSKPPAGLHDPAGYPESWLFPMDDRWLKSLRREVRSAIDRGMRPDVFAKVGDSNVIAYNAFYGLGCREPVWAGHEDLAMVVAKYRRAELPPGGDIAFSHSPDAPDRLPWNSFTRRSGAAMMGIVAGHLYRRPEEMDELPHWWAPDPERLPGESAVETEIRLIRPLWCLIQIGTNGYSYGHSPELTASTVGELARVVRRSGSVPVLIGLPPSLNHEAVPLRWEFAERANRLIAELAARERVPYLNQWLALTRGEMVNYGLIEQDGQIFDGFHLETFGGFKEPGSTARAVDFTPQALRYGANLRNLLMLRLLRDLDKAAGSA